MRIHFNTWARECVCVSVECVSFECRCSTCRVYIVFFICMPYAPAPLYRINNLFVFAKPCQYWTHFVYNKCVESVSFGHTDTLKRGTGRFAAFDGRQYWNLAAGFLFVCMFFFVMLKNEWEVKCTWHTCFQKVFVWMRECVLYVYGVLERYGEIYTYNKDDVPSYQ